jgi:hypothetical protein
MVVDVSADHPAGPILGRQEGGKGNAPKEQDSGYTHHPLHRHTSIVVRESLRATAALAPASVLGETPSRTTTPCA